MPNRGSLDRREPIIRAFGKADPNEKSGAVQVTVHQLDPLRDRRWARFVERHQQASVFHTPGWLEALRRTYGYEPVTYTTAPPGAELSNGLVLCRVQSRLTGRRLVSLPFSDHCEPLVECPDDLKVLLASIDLGGAGGLSHIEIRPRTLAPLASAELEKAETFRLHTIDLTPSVDEIFGKLHKNSVRRMIHRAQREGITYEEGRSDTILEKFYGLLLRTRRRHGLPPHPRRWFRNVLDCLGDYAKIRIASNRREPIAGILTLGYRKVLTYKYAVSDERFHKLGGVHLLLWRTIQEGKDIWARELDLGRSDSDNSGLITFKGRWGATETGLTYWRLSTRPAVVASANWRMQLARQMTHRLSSRMPNLCLTIAARFLYRHFG